MKVSFPTQRNVNNIPPVTVSSPKKIIEKAKQIAFFAIALFAASNLHTSKAFTKEECFEECTKKFSDDVWSLGICYIFCIAVGN